VILRGRGQANNVGCNLCTGKAGGLGWGANIAGSMGVARGRCEALLLSLHDAGCSGFAAPSGRSWLSHAPGHSPVTPGASATLEPLACSADRLQTSTARTKQGETAHGKIADVR
jgi:hypothetical protein